MRIALTGGAGFTGVHFTQHARNAGHEVVLVRSDLTDAQALAAEIATLEIDAMLHLAAISFVGHQDERAFYDVNLFGTLNLLEALSKAGRPLQRVLLASSANVYGNRGEAPMSEDLPPAPVNHYAVSKLAMEYMARGYLDRLPLVTARPFNYTGPGQPLQFVIPKLVDHFRRGAASVRLGNVRVQREYNDVRFLCEAYLQLLSRGCIGEVYNVCTGATHDLSSVIDLLKQLTGQTIEVEVDPTLIRANEVQRLCGNPARMRDLLPELPSFSLENTLRWMLSTPA